MKIVFDKKAGELLDLFWSLYYMANYDYVQSEVKKLGIEVNGQVEEEFLELMKRAAVEKELLNFYFGKDTMISEALVPMDEVFDVTLDELLEKLSSLSKRDILLRLLKELLSNSMESEISRNEEANRILDEDRMIEFIKELKIEASAKWHLYCFADDIEKHILEFVGLVKRYEPIYLQSVKKHRGVINRFNDDFERRIDKEAAFLQEITRGLYKPEDYKTLYISTTYYYTYNMFLKSKDQDGYLILGIDFEKAIKSLEGQGELENSLLVFKNLSDKTRFDIVKLLLRKNYFGQELAEELEITSATVSYHMNFLLASKLINVERREHKAYYTLNKETLRKCIDFINREFKL